PPLAPAPEVPGAGPQESAAQPAPSRPPLARSLPPAVTDPTLFAGVDLVRAQYGQLRDGVVTRRSELQRARQDADAVVEARRQAVRDAETAVNEVAAQLAD